MRRVISFLLCLILMAPWIVPVSAAGPEIIFTAESGIEPGCTVEVDKDETLMSCYNNGTSEIYNAYLEGFVNYYWYCDGEFYSDGPSLTITEEHRGHTFYCLAYLYEDDDRNFYVGEICSRSFTVPSDGPEIIFTMNSRYEPGCTMEVDKGVTLMSCYNYGTSEIYNAYLEGNVQYYWMRNGAYYADGPSLTIREEDRGCWFYCTAALYDDDDRTQQIGTISSAVFTVPAAGEPEIPEITTTELPKAVVGLEYYFQLECTDPDVTYTLLQSTLPDGLYLNQYGQIEGTPTKAGFWYVVIMAIPEAGEEYAGTAEFEFYVLENGTCTVNYYFGDSLYQSKEVACGAYAEDLVPPKEEGKSFKGWLTADGEYYDFSEPVTSDVNLYGVYGYAVVLCFGEEPIGSQIVEEGECAVEPEPPAQEGKIFLGWYTADGELYDFSTPVTREIWLYAKWQDAGAFSDVPADSFYAEPVKWALEQGITTGATASTFDPNGACLRAHVVTFLWRAAQKPEPNGSRNPFNDVKSNDFFYKPVLWAVERSITNGTSADKFGSYENCNRAAVVTFLWRAAGCPEPKSTRNPFVDVKPGDFFYEAVLWAVENKITNGVDATQFGPTTDCNRAQVVTFLYRANN